MTRKPATPYGYAIFCDDIRQEIGGKYSIMGIYSKMILLHQTTYPVTLSRLGVAAALIESIDQLPKVVDIQAFLPGAADDSPTQQFAIQISDLKREADKFEATPEKNKFLTAHINFAFAPITFREDGPLRIIAVRDGEPFQLGKIHVKLAPPPPEA